MKDYVNAFSIGFAVYGVLPDSQDLREFEIEKHDLPEGEGFNYGFSSPDSVD